MTNDVKKVPELRFPEFNEDWNERTLSDSIKILKSGLSRELSTTDIGLPVIRANNLQNYNLVLDDIKYWFKEDPKGAKTENYYLEKNDILVNFINSEAKMGTSCIIKSDFKRDTIYTTNILRYVTKEAYDSYFHYIYTQTYNYKKWIKIITKPAVNQASFTTVDFKKIPYYIPEFKEQQKIGEFFSKLDRQIELEEQKLAKLEEQKKGYMQKIFSQELRFKDENGNEYPEWEEKTIKDVYKVTRGYVLARKLMSDNPNSINKYPVYSSQTSNNGLMGYYSDYLYQDAITWTTDGANAGSVSFRQGKFYCTNVCGVLLNELGNSNVCMAEMLNNIAFKYVSKVGNPKLMNNVMAMIKLKFPCLEEQQAISKFLNVFSEVIDNQNKKVELLKERKKGFLQKMFV